jgi:flagellar protein FlbT
MSLKLTLKPGEKVVVNGAVLTNGPAKATVSVENQAVILRHRDVMQADDANTPAKRIYYHIQLAYLDRDNAGQYLERTNELVRDFVAAVPTPEVCALFEPLGVELAQNRYFQALKRCREIIAYEEKRLNYGREPLRNSH